jgi:hypothetical protein
MPGAALRKGIESMVAEVLRAHVLDAVLSRPEVRKGLSPEAIERIRKDVLEHLKASEEQGRTNRAEVEALLDQALASTGPAGLALKGLLKAGWDRLSAKDGEAR